MKPTVGFVGLGLMGRPMALNVAKAGYPLVVWNRTASRADDLVAAGARVAATPRDLAAESDVIVTIVSDPPAVEGVLWGAEGLLAGLKKGATLVDSSTISPALAKRSAAACAERGAAYLDAPVTGGTWGAEKGELVFLVGGEAATLEAARPVLETMGKRFFHLGPHGAGQTVKVAMNLLFALEVGAFSEAMSIVVGAGLPPARLVEVMQASMGRAPVLDIKAPLMIEERYAPSFPLRLMHKDLGLAIDLANQLGVPVPTAAASREVYSAVLGAASEDLDYAAVAKFWQGRGKKR
jgi:3-hydroxyisobutyrate dehydrogenase